MLEDVVLLVEPVDEAQVNDIEVSGSCAAGVVLLDELSCL